MKEILSEQDRTELSDLIARVERDTAGELVLVVARRSASYGAYRAAWAAVAALLLAAVVHLVWPELSASWLLGLQAPFGLLLWWVFGAAWILRHVTPRLEQQRAVSDRMKQLFLERGVTETRDRSGVLVYLSQLERRAEILGDRGIHQQLGEEAWQKMVGELVGAIRGGKAREGLAAIITRIGQELSAKFPPRPDDTNELSDAVVTDRRY